MVRKQVIVGTGLKGIPGKLIRIGREASNVSSLRKLSGKLCSEYRGAERTLRYRARDS